MWFTNIGTLFTGKKFLHDVSLRVEAGRVVDCLPSPQGGEGSGVRDCRGQVILPGRVDCHTPLVFAGSRAHEFELRSKGATYGEIMAAGGGIRSTMRAVRAASKDQLIELALPRLARMHARGVCVAEVKTGYGLSLDAELKMLEVIKALNTLQPVELVATFLGAHAVPPEFEAEAYVEHVVKDMLPAVKAQGIATACDVFVERGDFSVPQAKQILETARDFGLHTRVHAEQLSHSGGCQLAAELGALSASHLEFATPADTQVLAQAGVIAELLPIAQEYLGMKQLASGRILTDAGCKVAVATDFNPGSAMCDDLLLAARLAVTRGGLTCEEALRGITRYGALALGRSNIGILEPGSLAKLCLLESNNWVDLFYDWLVGLKNLTYVPQSGT